MRRIRSVAPAESEASPLHVDDVRVARRRQRVRVASAQRVAFAGRGAVRGRDRDRRPVRVRDANRHDGSRPLDLDVVPRARAAARGPQRVSSVPPRRRRRRRQRRRELERRRRANHRVRAVVLPASLPSQRHARGDERRRRQHAAPPRRERHRARGVRVDVADGGDGSGFQRDAVDGHLHDAIVVVDRHVAVSRPQPRRCDDSDAQRAVAQGVAVGRDRQRRSRGLSEQRLRRRLFLYLFLSLSLVALRAFVIVVREAHLRGRVSHVERVDADARGHRRHRAREPFGGFRAIRALATQPQRAAEDDAVFQRRRHRRHRHRFPPRGDDAEARDAPRARRQRVDRVDRRDRAVRRVDALDIDAVDRERRRQRRPQRDGELNRLPARRGGVLGGGGRGEPEPGDDSKRSL
mmetsp:Transcript_10755/g.38933  ORF Transcript_10755/g.38933 Transcript_10755/m.38933 type:complete len:407 (-) Transcript_10755:579-1799(-)